MKKLILIIVSLCIFFPATVLAGWTYTVTLDKKVIWNDGRRMYRVKVACLSDGSDPDEIALSSYITDILDGALLYQIETDPGTAPDAVWDVDFDTGLGADIMDLSGLSVTASELHDVDNDAGFYPIIFDVQIDIADIGTSGDTVDIYLYFIK